jgi:hypothetical protein
LEGAVTVEIGHRELEGMVNNRAKRCDVHKIVGKINIIFSPERNNNYK